MTGAPHDAPEGLQAGLKLWHFHWTTGSLPLALMMAQSGSEMQRQNLELMHHEAFCCLRLNAGNFDHIQG
jgi:hypothetical protein